MNLKDQQRTVLPSIGFLRVLRASVVRRADWAENHDDF